MKTKNKIRKVLRTRLKPMRETLLSMEGLEYRSLDGNFIPGSYQAKQLIPASKKKKEYRKTVRPVLDMRGIGDYEDRLLWAIDNGRNIQGVIDWQYRSRMPYKEPDQLEELYRAGEKYNLKKTEIELFHLTDSSHGPGLYSKQLAKKQHIKATTIRQRKWQAKKRLKKQLEAENNLKNSKPPENHDQ